MSEQFRVLIVDHVGTLLNEAGQPDFSEVQAHIESLGGSLHTELPRPGEPFSGICFTYLPTLSTSDDILAVSASGMFDAVIAAATIIPEAARFPLGGVRIGTGTGNMRCLDWGGVDGSGGKAPLMNTPGFNSVCTAQATVSILIERLLGIDKDTLHQRVTAGTFDTGKDLSTFPYIGVAGKTVAVLGFGNIARETVRLLKAFRMNVRVYARNKHQAAIEAAGCTFAATPVEAALGSDALTVHLGLGPQQPATGHFANTGLIDTAVFEALNPGAVVINFDRAELMNTAALGHALEHGRLRNVSIDADIFIDAEGKPSGPLSPLLPLANAHPDTLLLLPHAVADTEHRARTAGAKQAVSQIVAALRHKTVINGKGDIPPGYTDGGSYEPIGVGRCTPEHIAGIGDDRLNEIRQNLQQALDVVEKLHNASNPSERMAISAGNGERLTLALTRLSETAQQAGWLTPFRDC